MFRRQRPPVAPATPTPPVPPVPSAPPVDAGGSPAGSRPAEPAVAPSIPATAAPSTDTGSETSPRTTMNTPFSTPPGGPLASAAPSLKTEIPRRVVDIPNSPPKRVAPTGVEGNSAAAATEMRKLIVGRDISLSGEIAACDVLVVEGTVEAKLRDGHVVEIADTGLFKGSVEIDEADIGGRFEGDITVRNTLKVRSTGRINGNIRYGTLEVENGGQLSGTIQVLGGAPVATPAAAEQAAAPVPLADTTADATAESAVG
ncbi:polymer-forming cytoskeletal protein [Niveispirillum sp.]|uniref:bactofilin family protein n=1 Tax=Niveispirillum sp. TaxID=1917217 RepID=UPI0025FE9B24|nr:polymer-forming cytoskeletal protein [Niveispirillum sp.]